MHKSTEIARLPLGINNYLDVSDRSLLILEGTEGKDLLQRLGTNDMSNLDIGAECRTILTNEKGRIVEVLSVLMISPDKLLLVGQSRGPDRLRGWLDKFIIMEDVKILMPEVAYWHLILYKHEISPKAEENRSGSMPEDGTESLRRALRLPPESFSFEERWGDVSIFHVLIDRRLQDTLKLPKQYPSLNNEVQFERFRLFHGIPVSPNELSELYNPLEANLGGLISWTKGCYIGQEVIARLDTYKKVQKHLVRVQMEEQPASLPVKLFCQEREAGMLTSAVSLEDGRIIGLAYIGANTSLEDKLLFEFNGRNVVVEQIDIQRMQ